MICVLIIIYPCYWKKGEIKQCGVKTADETLFFQFQITLLTWEYKHQPSNLHEVTSQTRNNTKIEDSWEQRSYHYEGIQYK